MIGRGIDARLDRVIAGAMRPHEEHPPVRAEFGPVRDRSREGFRVPGRSVLRKN